APRKSPAWVTADMTRLAALLLALTLAGCGGCVSVVPSHDTLRSAALRLTYTDGVCSGTAVGPDLLVTAIHCGDPVAVNGQAVTVVERYPGKRDFLLLRISGVTFDRYLQRGPEPRQGDRVRWFGNPVGESDVYRQGYVARVTPDAVLIAAQICKGDSGAGILNDRGEVVGIVSA